MKTMKSMLFAAVIASICGAMVAGCGTSRRGGRQDNRIDNRDDRSDNRHD